MTKKRGRPVLDPEQRQDQRVSVRLTARDYDDVQKKAAADRVSVPEYFRRQARQRIIDGQ